MIASTSLFSSVESTSTPFIPPSSSARSPSVNSGSIPETLACHSPKSSRTSDSSNACATLPW
jgi:hypothetical protein